jgi:hypothetical protein
MSYDGIYSVVGKRGLFMCRFPSIFLLQRLKGYMSGEVRNFNKIEMQALIKFCTARQGDEGNSGYSDINIRGTCTILCYRQNWVSQDNILPPLMFLLLEDPKR